MEKAFKKAKKAWMPDPNNNSVFMARRRKGRLWTLEPVIQFHVKRKLSLSQLSKDQIIPKEIGGVPTDVIMSNPVLSVSGRKLAAIQGGLSIGIEDQDAAGTLGLVMIDGTDGIVGITCAHVLLVNGAATPTLGGHVLHPAIEDGGSAGMDRVGIPTVQGLSVGSGIDSAAFSVDYSYGLSIFDTLILPSGSRNPEVDDELQKVGRTSGLTDGQVSGIGAITIDYSDYGAGSVEMSMISIIPLDTEPNAVIATGGDSGAVWYYPGTGEAGAVHVAHELASNIAYAIFFSSALGGAGISNPLLATEYGSERKGSTNFVVPYNYEIKGSAILSGSGPIFSTRLTAVNQDTTVGYPTIKDLFEAGGIRFLDGTETEIIESVTLPTWTQAPAEWSDTPVPWGDYSPSTAIVVPTYVSSSSFTVNGDNTADYPVGLKLYLVQGAGLDAVVSVVSATYNTGTNKTTVVVDPASVLVSITQVKFGLLPAQMPVHSHSSIKETYTQTSHGFTVQQAIYRNGSTWALAKADALATAEAVGVIESVSGNAFTIVFGGAISGLTGLTPGSRYFVSEITAGLLTTDEPVDVSKYILMAITSTTGVVINTRSLVAPV